MELSASFVQKFAGIPEMYMEACNSDGVLRQLQRALVNPHAGTLCQLRATMLYGEYSTQPFQNLIFLVYRCNLRSFPVLPKINSLPLETFQFLEFPVDFSWSFFQKNPGGSDSRKSLTLMEGLHATVPTGHTSV